MVNEPLLDFVLPFPGHPSPPLYHLYVIESLTITIYLALSLLTTEPILNASRKKLAPPNLLGEGRAIVPLIPAG